MPFFQKEPSEEWAGIENLIAAQYNSKAEQQEQYRAPCQVQYLAFDDAEEESESEELFIDDEEEMCDQSGQNTTDELAENK